jgi:hypothetical protein
MIFLTLSKIERRTRLENLEFDAIQIITRNYHRFFPTEQKRCYNIFSYAVGMFTKKMMKGDK